MKRAGISSRLRVESRCRCVLGRLLKLGEMRDRSAVAEDPTPTSLPPPKFGRIILSPVVADRSDYLC